MNNSSSPFRGKKGQWLDIFGSELRFCYFRERVCNFSLRSRPIGLSDFFGTRREVALRGEDYAWAPVWGSFDKLREVGVLFYLLYLLFKYFVDG